MALNKELDRQSDQLDSENARLRMHIRECNAEEKRTHQTTVKLERDIKEQQDQMASLDNNIAAIEQDIQEAER